MGLFDNKVIELGQNLATNLEKRATEIQVKRETEKEVGLKFTYSMAEYVMREIAEVIRNTTKDA